MILTSDRAFAIAGGALGVVGGLAWAAGYLWWHLRPGATP